MNCVYLNFCALLFLWKFISSSTLPLVTTFILHKSFSFSSLSHKSLFKNPSAPWKQSPREMMIRIEQFSCWRCQQLFAVVKISTFECYWKFMIKWNLRLIAFARARYKIIFLLRWWWWDCLNYTYTKKIFRSFSTFNDCWCVFLASLVFTNYHNLTWIWRFFREFFTSMWVYWAEDYDWAFDFRVCDERWKIDILMSFGNLSLGIKIKTDQKRGSKIFF